MTAALLLCLAPWTVVPALGTPRTNVSFIGSDGAGREAIVQFDIMGGNLVITLTNSATGDVLQPSQVLCAMFFDVSGSILPLDNHAAGASVVLNPGPPASTVLFPPNPATDPGGGIGGEWAYNYSTKMNGSHPDWGRYGVSGSGFGRFNPSDRFPGSNLSGGSSVDGVDYCITSAGDNPSTGKSSVSGANPLVKNSVVITIPGLPPGFDLGRISNVGFQYDHTGNGVFVPVPEPHSFVLMMAAVVLAGRRTRRRR